MLAKRIIPCLDIKEGRVVKGVNFVSLRDAGSPVELARRYRDDGADELVFLDITASSEGRKTVVELVQSIARAIDIPFTVGGGIHSFEDARSILSNGADKISINTAAVQNPNLISKLSDRFGKQCVVCAIDAKHNTCFPSGYQVFIHGGRTPVSRDAREWAQEAIEKGSGEILLTSMDRDGTKNGFDHHLTTCVADVVRTPIIASGGAGSPQDFADLFIQTPAAAGLAASVFHYEQYPVPVVKAFLKAKGVNVR